MIKKFKKDSYRWSVIGVVAILAVSSLSLLNARADRSDEQQKEQTTEMVNTNERDYSRVVTKEDQEHRESMLNEKDQVTVITKEEQKMVENMSVKEGFVPQEEGTGFFFTKEK